MGLTCPRGSLLDADSFEAACSYYCRNFDLGFPPKLCKGNCGQRMREPGCVRALSDLIDSAIRTTSCQVPRSEVELTYSKLLECIENNEARIAAYQDCSQAMAPAAAPIPAATKAERESPAARAPEGRYAAHLACFDELGGRAPGAPVVNRLGKLLTIPAPRGKQRGFYAYTADMAYYFPYPTQICRADKTQTHFVVRIRIPREPRPVLALLSNGTSLPSQRLMTPPPDWARSCAVTELDGSTAQAMDAQSDLYLRQLLVFTLRFTRKSGESLGACRKTEDPAITRAADARLPKHPSGGTGVQPAAPRPAL